MKVSVLCRTFNGRPQSTRTGLSLLDPVFSFRCCVLVIQIHSETLKPVIIIVHYLFIFDFVQFLYLSLTHIYEIISILMVSVT